MAKRNNPLLYVLMFGNFVVYSLVLALSRWAGQFPLLSMDALWRYFLGFVLLGVYAVVWQQVLKHVPLTIAYASRAVTVLLGMLWAVVFFSEVISLQMGIGAAFVICGVVLVAWR